MIFDLFPWPTGLDQYAVPLVLDNSQIEIKVIK
jgi:hypothetical protein